MREYIKDYFWIVLCKNRRFHHQDNLGYEHRIVLGETDAYSPPPVLPDHITVRCDSCGKEYAYKKSELFRDEVQVPDNFLAHPLFAR